MDCTSRCLLAELFPQLDHQKRVIAKSLRKKKKRANGNNSPQDGTAANNPKLDDKVPKAYRLDTQYESSEESNPAMSEEEVLPAEKSNEDSGLDSDTSLPQDKLDQVQVSSLLSDMQKIKEDLIRRNEYEKLKEKCRRSDSDDD
ncbi:hypothetical protein HF086_005565 [Spodoptera exigua]|uniref:Uncharacterized protein n=1 Tax=Spodoptera exigua TaxID=7107 RepID=A0A922MRK0_SPOEX|nr:hypothetical protein HF086_005565 [Spodoptera exigua]